MQISCVTPSCRKIFEAPRMHYTKFIALIMAHGWTHRGSQEGHVFYCDEHPPGYSLAKGKLK